MPDKEELYDEAIDAYADDKYDEAIELYKQALEIDPKYIDAIHGMMDRHWTAGGRRAPIELTKKFIEQAPEDILAFTNPRTSHTAEAPPAPAAAEPAEARRLDWKRQL